MRVTRELREQVECPSDFHIFTDYINVCNLKVTTDDHNEESIWSSLALSVNTKTERERQREEGDENNQPVPSCPTQKEDLITLLILESVTRCTDIDANAAKVEETMQEFQNTQECLHIHKQVILIC